MKTLSDLKCVVDVETTGFDPIKSDVIVAAMIMIDGDNNVLEKEEFRIRPSTWSEDAAKVHGISREEAMDYQPPREALVKIMRYLKPFKHPKNWPMEMIFHANRRFDYRFMEWLFRKEELQYKFWMCFNENNAVSTLKMARDLGHKSGNSLDKWAQRIGFRLDHHDASSDAMACLELYKHLIQQNREVISS